jgi:thiamine kinase-like enzyme
MSDYFDEKLLITLIYEKGVGWPGKPGDSILRLDDSMPFVLTHGDISMQNVIIDKVGKLWLIDWGFSGAYPKWFEYAAAKCYTGPNASWLYYRLAVLIIAGWYPKSALFIPRIDLYLMNYLMTLESVTS